MKKLFLVSFIVSMFLIGIVSVSAQETAPKIIRGGVLNGKAIMLPKPAFPEEARRDGASGPVRVEITIDEEGTVIEAKALAEFKTKGADGFEEIRTIHPALQEASENAALGAKFAPTKLSGQAIKVSGTIVYNFVSSPLADDKTVPRPVSGGVLNGKAVYLPAPVYPPAAKAVRAGGTVTVQVTIDENGMVVSAAAISGSPLLRASSVEAAKLAQFSPTLVDGQAVKVIGVLTYNFVPADSKEN